MRPRLAYFGHLIFNWGEYYPRATQNHTNHPPSYRNRSSDITNSWELSVLRQAEVDSGLDIEISSVTT